MRLQPALVGALFVVAGIAHFRWPQMYARIVPPFLPAPETLVAVSGAFEILGGVGAVVPATRAFSGWGLIALLAAVFPANLYMAVDAGHFRSVAPPAVLYARLPLQFVLAWWVYRACIARGSGPSRPEQ